VRRPEDTGVIRIESSPGKAPVLRDEVAAVVAKQQYPRERLQKKNAYEE
jgi:hypothetical protein